MSDDAALRYTILSPTIYAIHADGAVPDAAPCIRVTGRDFPRDRQRWPSFQIDRSDGVAIGGELAPGWVRDYCCRWVLAQLAGGHSA